MIARRFVLPKSAGGRLSQECFYQYFSTGRTSIAPPRRAVGICEANLIGASRFSASRAKYPPTAPMTST